MTPKRSKFAEYCHLAIQLLNLSNFTADTTTSPCVNSKTNNADIDSFHWISQQIKYSRNMKGVFYIPFSQFKALKVLRVGFCQVSIKTAWWTNNSIADRTLSRYALTHSEQKTPLTLSFQLIKPIDAQINRDLVSKHICTQTNLLRYHWNELSTFGISKTQRFFFKIQKQNSTEI